MVKRVLMALGAILMAGCAVILVWQPDSLKTQLMDAIAREVSRSTPYELSVRRVSGNIFTGFALQDIRVLTKEDHAELLKAKAIQIGISWWALFHRTIRIQQLNWVEPHIQVTLDENGRIVPLLKKKSSSSDRSAFPFHYSIRLLTVEKGQLLFVNRSLTPAQELVISDIDLQTRISSRRVTIDSMKWRLDKGTGNVTGRMAFLPGLAGEFEMTETNVPLEKVLETAGLATPMALPLSGQWSIQASSQTLTLAMNGSLAASPLSLDGQWADSGLRRANGAWSKPGVASVSVHMMNGQGPFHVALSSGNFKAQIDGEANTAQKSLRGKGTFSKIAWKGASAEHIDMTFSASPGDQQLQMDAKMIQFHSAESPFDVQNGHLTLRGAAPRWRTTLVAKFRNGSTVDLAGAISRQGERWRLAWNTLALSFPSAGTWTAEQPGAASGSMGRMELENVFLKNGSQSVQIPQASMDTRGTRLVLLAHDWDPGPWITLWAPDVALKGAFLNASLHWTDQPPHSELDGFVTGKASSLTAPALGLAIKDIDIDIQGEKGQIQIKRFSGKTKKGEIALSGGGPWPNLDYTLTAHHFQLSGNPLMKGTGDLDLHAKGTALAPVVTGHIAIKDAVYTIAAKDDKKKTASVSAAPRVPRDTLWKRTALDITAEWPRNVWYREGVTNIETQAELRFVKAKQDETVVLTGTIRSIRGSYNYFGRDFAIESGEIEFAGTPDNNPLLKISASYRSDPTIVYLDITGTANQPTLKLRSNPPLPEQDIISVIVFGQPLSELRTRSGSQTSNQQMLQAAGGVLGSYVSRELRQTGISQLNLDVLNLQPTSQGSQLTLGRYLSRRLFVSYGQAIRGSAEKSITADYFLTDKWTLQGASDSTQGNYMDLLFRYPLSRAGSASNNPALPTSPFRNSLDQPDLQQPGYGR